MDEPRSRAAIVRSGLLIGGELALDLFEVWRRDLACLDALILLAVTRSNVDGILYDRALRARFGGTSRLAPDNLRQPVSPSVVALSLRLPEKLVERRAMALAKRGECELTPAGMLITAHQVEATSRTEIIRSAYDALRRCYLRLRTAGFFTLEPLLPLQNAPEPPVRSAAAHGAKYLLRLLATLGHPAGDLTNALLLLEIMRGGADPPSAISSAPEYAMDPVAMGARLGLTAQAAKRRARTLESNGTCRVTERGVLAVAEDGPWFAQVAEKNPDHLFQLFAALAEIGALADFGAGEQSRDGPD